MTTCPTEDEWLAVTARDVALDAVATHAESCEACRGRLRRVSAVQQAASAPMTVDVARVLSGVDARLERRPGPSWRVVMALAAGLVAVVGAGLVVRQTGLAGDDGFVARGSTRGWQDRVRVEVRQVERPAEPLVAGQVLDAESPLTLWYRNAEHETPLFVTAWLVDAAGETSWIAPAYLEEGVEPPPAMLRATDAEVLWTSSVKLASPAPGNARLVVVVTRAPRSVLEVERLSVAQRREPTFVAGEAVVWTRDVVVAGAAP
jgi:hypothetical protein